MPQQRTQTTPTTGPLTVVRMADRLALSVRRFYELIDAGKFPPPVYRIDSRRPFYPPELQEVCVRIRETGEALDGTLVMFNRPRTRPAVRRPVPAPRRATQGPTAQADGAGAHEHADLIAYLAGQGVTATAGQVEAALVALFPGGWHGIEQGRVWRDVFRHLRQQNRT